MPIYEYSCPECDSNFEHLQRSSNETATCPKCDNSKVDRKVSRFSSPGSLSSEEASGAGCGCTPSSCGCH
ncbi:MAG: zinc ribbon domain-containing protein [Deltaproteobacteria bacterium]|nr:zinc ribbon domain-containing protein [Deltaproteobacteria bacterium]